MIDLVTIKLSGTDDGVLAEVACVEDNFYLLITEPGQLKAALEPIFDNIDDTLIELNIKHKEH